MEIMLTEPFYGLRAHPWDSRLVWVYRVDTPIGGEPLTMPLKVILREHRCESRQSPRHKWRHDTGYEGWKWRHSANTVHDHGFRMPADKVPVPPDLKGRVMAELAARVEFVGAFDPPEARKFLR